MAQVGCGLWCCCVVCGVVRCCNGCSKVHEIDYILLAQVGCTFGVREVLFVVRCGAWVIMPRACLHPAGASGLQFYAALSVVQHRLS